MRWHPALTLLVSMALAMPSAWAQEPSGQNAEAFDKAIEATLRDGTGGTPAEAEPILARLRALLPAGDAFRQRRFDAATCSAPQRSRRAAFKQAEERLAAELSQANPDAMNLALLHFCKGTYRPNNSEPRQIVADYDAGIEQARKAEHPLLLGVLLATRSGGQSMIGAYARSLTDALEAQRILDELDETNLSAIVSQNVGIAFRRMGEYGRAEEYLLRSLETPVVQKKWVYRLVNQLQLGYVYEETHRYAEARQAFEQAIATCEANDSPVDCGYARLGLASVEANDGRAERSLALLDEAAKDFEKAEDPGDPTMTALVRGQALLGQGKHEEARRSLDTAINRWTLEENTRYLVLALPVRSAAFEALGQPARALEDLHRYIALSGEDRNRRAEQRTEFMREQFDASRREIENAELRAREAARVQEIAALNAARRWQWIAMGLAVVLLVGLVVVVMRQVAKARRLRLLAMTDPLTGLANRRHTDYRGSEAFKMARLSDQPFCVLAIDIDHFKTVNDTHGHAVGDTVLQRVGRECQRTLRKLDLMGRIGGEEFTGLLPETAEPAACQVAERLRVGVASLDLDDVVPGLRITISIGVAQMRDNDPDFAAVLARADAAMYRAKQGGRNRVVSDETA